MNNPYDAYPTAEEAHQVKLRSEIKKAIVDGHGVVAARLTGELKKLRPIVFQQGARPEIWRASDALFDPDRRRYHGLSPDFLSGEIEPIINDPPHGIWPGRLLLEKAGVDPVFANVLSHREAAARYQARVLSEQVGTYHVESGGVAVRLPDGDLWCFREPTDTDRRAAVLGALNEAGYEQGGELPLVITNNPDTNAAAFIAQRPY